MTPTPGTAYALLDAVDPLARPARLRLVAATARELAGTPALTSMLAELGTGGVFERGLALTMARIARDDAFVVAALADPDFGLRCQALAAVLDADAAGRHDAAVLATLEDAPVAWQRAVVRAVRGRRLTGLADRLVGAGADGARATDGAIDTREDSEGSEGGGGTATASAPLPEPLVARLLPACSPQVVAALLPRLVHLPIDWQRLGLRHPDIVLDVVEHRLAEAPEGLRATWWTRCAPGVAGAAEREPGRVLDLLERHDVWRRCAFPAGLLKRLRFLAACDPARTLRLLVDAAADGRHGRLSPLLISGGTRWYTPRTVSRAVRRQLLLAAPADAVRWGTLCRDDEQLLARLLKTLPPSGRGAFYDAVTAGRDPDRAVLGDLLLDVLPRERRHREARRMLTLPTVQALPALRLRISARLPWAEGRAPLLAETRVADAAARGSAYQLLIRCVTAEADPGLFAEFLAEDLTRLRNEQDPVRQPALRALADTPPWLYDGRALPALRRLSTDAVEVRDRSIGSLSSLRLLARRVLVHHAGSGEADLLAWCLDVMEQIEGTTGAVDHERLDTLRRGQERAVVDVLTPWVERGLARDDHRRLLALVQALGRRARALPDVQAWLEATIWRAPSAVVSAAVGYWIDDPAHRDERVARLVEWDPTVAKFAEVAWHLADRRTDLLDRYLTGEVLDGRFVATGTRWFPQFPIGPAARWLPRQQVAYAKLLGGVARDRGATVRDRVDAIRRSALLGAAGAATVRRFVGSTDVPIMEAALGALAWLPDPESAIPELLEHSDGDRARVAVYAVTRAAQYARPSEVESRLRAVLAAPDAKVTSRKEALRIAAQVGVPNLVDLLLATWDGPGQHRHVRMAAVTRLADHLDDPRVWPALRSATTQDRDVALELLRRAPLNVPDRHRGEYGLLVAALASHPEQVVRQAALRQAAGWYRWAPGVADAVVAALLDVADADPVSVEAAGRLLGNGWPIEEFLKVVRQLVDLAAVEVDGGGSAPGAGDQGSNTEKAGAAAPASAAGAADPVAVRDRPARRRVEQLAVAVPTSVRSDVEDWRPVLAAFAELLTPEPGWLRQAADLRARALDLTADAESFAAECAALAGLTAGRPLTAQAATETLRTRIFQGDPIDPAAFLVAAARLAADPRPAAGVLAVALTGAAGAESGWTAPWRAVVGTLRRHPDPDVAELALRLNTEHSWQQ